MAIAVLWCPGSPTRSKVPEMADAPRFSEKIILRFTLARIADLFNACEQLPESEKQAAYDEIKRRIEEIRPIRTDYPDATETFSERCRKLAVSAPNDKIQNILLMIAQVCETEGAANNL